MVIISGYDDGGYGGGPMRGGGYSQRSSGPYGGGMYFDIFNSHYKYRRPYLNTLYSDGFSPYILIQ